MSAGRQTGERGLADGPGTGSYRLADPGIVSLTMSSTHEHGRPDAGAVPANVVALVDHPAGTSDARHRARVRRAPGQSYGFLTEPRGLETQTIVHVIGARPNFVKMAPIVTALQRRGIFR